MAVTGFGFQTEQNEVLPVAFEWHDKNAKIPDILRISVVELMPRCIILWLYAGKTDLKINNTMVMEV